MIVLPGTRTKNKRTHVVPLSASAQAVLAAQQPKDGSFVFCGTRAFASWSRGKRELDARLAAAGTKLDHWTQHDLRRSVATGMAELGIAPHIVEAVLNHVRPCAEDCADPPKVCGAFAFGSQTMSGRPLAELLLPMLPRPAGSTLEVVTVNGAPV